MQVPQDLVRREQQVREDTPSRILQLNWEHSSARMHGANAVDV